MKLTEHFSLEEFTRSQYAARHGIDNTPGPNTVLNLHRVADVLERVRGAVGDRPITVTSGYRNSQLNRLVGGSVEPPSAHVEGRAADIVVWGMSPYAVAKAIQASGIEFDQLILEFDEWVHIGIPRTGNAARGEVLTYRMRGGEVIKVRGVVPRDGHDSGV